MRITIADMIGVRKLPQAGAEAIVWRLGACNGQISRAAFEVILKRLEAIPAGAPDHLHLTSLGLIIDQGLLNIKNKKPVAGETILAAEEFGLMFAGTKDGVVLALKREVEELEALHEGLRLIDFPTLIARHQEVAAFHRAIQAIDALMKVDPNLFGDNVSWAQRDPKTGKFSAKLAFAERTETLPTAILASAKFDLSLTMVGTENATGVFWGGRMLYRTVPFDLTEIADYSFQVSQASGFLPFGGNTVKGVLDRLGFTAPAKRPVLEVFACLPSPSPTANEAEKFVPRGYIQLDSQEGGMYAIVTILQDKAQKTILTMEGNSSTLVMGEETLVAGQNQLTYLTFESVPAMSRERERETRTAQRGNILVLAIPVKPHFEMIIKSFDSPDLGSRGFDDDLFRGVPTRGGGGFSFGGGDYKLAGSGLTLGGGSPRPSVSIGSTNVGRDEKAASGMTVRQGGAVVVDHSRQPQLIRIVPIGISVANTSDELRATVIDFSTRQRRA